MQLGRKEKSQKSLSDRDEYLVYFTFFRYSDTGRTLCSTRRSAHAAGEESPPDDTEGLPLLTRVSGPNEKAPPPPSDKGRERSEGEEWWRK